MHPNRSRGYGTIFRSALKLCIVLVFGFFLSLSAYASTSSHCDAQIKQVQVAQAVSDHPAQRPDTGWQTVQLPDTWKHRWADHIGSVWYRIEWNYLCPNQNNTPIALSISSINMAGEVYLNDELFWQDRSLQEPLSRSRDMPRYWILPASALKHDNNTLWIRVVGKPLLSAGLGDIYLGEPHQVLIEYENALQQKRIIIFMRFICAGTLGIICFLIWLFRRQETAFGWFAFGCLFWVLFIFLMLKTETAPFANTLIMAKLSSILQLLYVMCFCLYTWRFANKTFRLAERLLWGCAIIMTLLIGIAPYSHLSWLLPTVFIYVVSLFFVNCMFYPYIAWQSKQIEQYILAGCLTLFCVLGIYQFFVGEWKINSFIARPIAPIVALFIATSLALRLSRNIKKVEQFNQTLEQNIQQVKHELSTSLNKQHQLELKNTRLQERIHLAHDLHDSLGGALVRSMIMVDQSKVTLTNQQFLSMLKLLRDDLRQVIDSGSSNGAKVPDTPALWGASIRRRFSQLFDEIDINSHWSFTAHWQFQLTAFECLTLLRVAEEALTNIIKHSQAKNVRVALYYTDTPQLVLEIEDDGIGFDIEMVKQSGISVGLRSMQIRLEKIQANISIQSQSGKTLIQVVKMPSIKM